MRERRESILRSWEELVRANAPGVARFTRALRDHLPALLDGLAQCASGAEETGRTEIRRAASRHALQRLDEHVDLAQVLEEYRFLRQAILREVFRAVEPARPGLADLAQLHTGIDVALSEAVARFVAAGAERERERADMARATEIALRESEEKLRLLADAMPQIVCVLSPDGTPEYVNASWIAFSGRDLAETRRTGWAGCLHPDDLDAARECRRRVLEGLAPQDVELRYRAADGTYRWYLSRLAPIIGERHVVRLIGAAMDIEDRRRREETLREQLALQDQLAKVAASVPGVVCSFRLRPDGAVSMPFSAPAIAEFYGIPQAELARDMTPAFARIPADDVERVRATVGVSARTMTPWHAVFRYEHPTKGLRWIEGTSIPSREDDGSILWHGFVADVTERKLADAALREANERLRESDRRKDEFLGMLSHELRNPLAPIRNALYILDRVEPGGPQARRAREIATRQVVHLARLVDDLLDVTRIARGKIQLRYAEVDLVALAQRAAEDQRGLMEDRGLELSVHVPAGPVVVSGDETRLAQVLGNLLGNAAKFTPPGGRISVAVAAEDGRAVVHVRDTGMGIEPHMLDSIFEPFTQAQQSLARTEGGLGLGLALVKGLVALHRGEISVASEGAGRGTDFAITLPLARPPSADAGEPGAISDGPAGPRHRVLVVDDNQDAADTLAQLVRMLGHDADVAHDGPGAIAAARAHPPDVVLCDIGLPGMDGYAVARELRATGSPGLRLVAVSGYAQPEDVARAAEAGFDEHVAKPPDPGRLASILG
ncbi:MAG TPA: ATP-binding protein [Anaeromyxobacteraceae bacterium]|nr:ATP-binding protein [Anaeromyxobacteraceae bacterium]